VCFESSHDDHDVNDKIEETKIKDEEKWRESFGRELLADTGMLLFFCVIFFEQRQLCDLELIMNGGFSPLEGFMTQADYEG